MSAVETTASQTTVADTSAQFAVADMEPAATQATTPPSPSNSSINDLEAMVAQAQDQIASNTGDTGGVIEGVLTAITTIVSALVSLVSTLLGRSSTGAGDSTGEIQNASVKPEVATAQSNVQSSPTSVNSSSAAASSSTSGSSTSATTSTPRSYFDVIRSDQGMVTVRTLDGFVVRAEGKDQAWSISGPDGRTTRIWGDPHVTESDGDTWSFKERGTFVFGKNKATIEVVPAGNGQTLSSRLTIYAGDERVTIGGIGTNGPVITAVSHDGKQHDDSLADGVIYARKLNQTGEAWTTKNGSKTVVMK